jgi:protein-disulfide isomerase
MDKNTPISNELMVFKRSWVYSALLPLAFVAGLAFGYVFWGRNNASTSPQAQQAAAEQPVVVPTEAQVTRYDVPVDDDPALGPADAPITIIEFSDYECPYCQKWQAETMPKLLAGYGGKIRFIYRDFPLYGSHANAASAAEAANCAGDQGKYFEFHDKLFSGAYSLGQAAYEKYAAEINLDIDQYKSCLTSRQYQKEVESDYQFAAELGIRSTPTFFINGLAVIGAQPYEVFQQIIDQELAGEIP